MNPTFTSYEGRMVRDGQRVQIYRNLRNKKWSIRDAGSGLVLGHADELSLVYVSFHTSKAGQQRVLKTGHKNVHAYAEGFYKGLEPRLEVYTREVFYNPFKAHLFLDQNNNTIQTAKGAVFGKEGMVLATEEMEE